MAKFSHGLCRSGDTVLVLIDIQTHLGAAMQPAIHNQLLENSSILAQAAENIDIPIIITRQYPDGLGDTEPVIPTLTATTIDKTTFSCSGTSGFSQSLKQTARHQIVLAGMESHVCVLQTAFDLQSENYQVFVVEDAVCSRTTANHRNAMTRLVQHGITVTNTESVLFEWLENASHPQFKSIISLIK